MSNYISEASSPFSNSETTSADKAYEGHATNKTDPQSYVTCFYQCKVAQICHNFLVTWSKNPTNHSLTIKVENICSEKQNTCKIDLKTWQFWGKKGLKSFEVNGTRFDVFWDFRQAKFSSSSSEPFSDYYVALVSNEEVILLLGDLKTDAYKRTMSRPSIEEAKLLYKEESVYGKRYFSTKAMFDAVKKEHEIIIENSLSGPDDPEMWITVDGMVVIRVTNLNWRFRGNETVMVDNVPLEIFWDVHDWLFKGPGSSHGLFIFKLGMKNGGCNLPSYEFEERNSSEESSAVISRCESQKGSSASEFCHFLYAWKID